MRTALILATLLMVACKPATPGISDGWVRAAPADARVLAGYFQLHNPGREVLRCTEASSPDFHHVMLHESVLEDGMMRMRHLDAIEVPADGTLALVPGGLHLMLMGPSRAFEVGDAIALSLDCGSLTLTTTLTVRPAT